MVRKSCRSSKNYIQAYSTHLSVTVMDLILISGPNIQIIQVSLRTRPTIQLTPWSISRRISKASSSSQAPRASSQLSNNSRLDLEPNLSSLTILFKIKQIPHLTAKVINSTPMHHPTITPTTPLRNLWSCNLNLSSPSNHLVFSTKRDQATTKTRCHNLLVSKMVTLQASTQDIDLISNCNK